MSRKFSYIPKLSIVPAQNHKSQILFGGLIYRQ